MTFFLVSSHLPFTRFLFKIASIKLRIVGTSSISHYRVTIVCEIEDPPAAFLSIASSVRSFLHVPRFLAFRWRGKYYSVDERRWRSGGEGRGGGVEKWRERTKEKGTLDSFGARNLAQLENEWHFNPRPRTRGQATRWKRRRHRCLHCKMIQRRRTKKQKERNTEGIGSECWKRARGTGDGSKDSVQVVKGRTETERVGERANTSVACLFKHVPVPWFLFQPLAPTYPPRLSALFAWSARVRGTKSRATLQLHCIIHTRHTESYPERTQSPCAFSSRFDTSETSPHRNQTPRYDSAPENPPLPDDRLLGIFVVSADWSRWWMAMFWYCGSLLLHWFPNEL